MKLSTWVLSLLLSAPIMAAPDPSSDKRLTIEFSGTTSQALRAIADQAGINVMVSGDLSQPTELHLREVNVEEALSTLAQMKNLSVERRGNVWTVSPRAEGAAAHPVAPKSGKAESERVATGDVIIRKGEAVQSAVSFGGDLVVEGEVERDAVAFGGNVIVQGRVRGDAVSFGGNVEVRDGAEVGQSTIAFGGSVKRFEGSRVGKDKVSMGAAALRDAMLGSDERRARRLDPASELSSRIGVPIFLVWFTILFAVSLLCLMFVPHRVRNIEDEMKRWPLQCGLTGMVGLFALPLLTVLLAITVVGIPLAIGLWLFVGVGLAMGVAAVASEIGWRLPVLGKRKTQAAVMALGLVVVLALGTLPVVGPIAIFLLSLLSLGALIRTRFGGRAPFGTSAIERTFR